MSSDQPSLLQMLSSGASEVWGVGAATVVTAWAGAWAVLRKSNADATRAKDEGALGLQKQMSVEVAAAFVRKDDEIAKLETALARTELDRDVGWDIARGYEDWARIFVRQQYDAVLAKLDAAYRIIARLAEDPTSPGERAEAVRMLAEHKAAPDVVVPSLADIKGKRPS